jgi:hypothetical protein
MGLLKDLSGQRFGRLVVVSRHGLIPKKPRGNRITWLCKCDCGNEKIALGEKLINGKTRSCGCITSPPLEEANEKTRKKIKKQSYINTKTGCWEWQKYLNRCGYGQISYRGNHARAHRISWIVFKGDIPEGLCVLHKCDNPKCINPDHLFLGTRKDNNDDMRLKGRRNDVGAPGIRARHAKFNDEQILNIRTYENTWKNCEILGKQFDVSPNTIYRILKRETWKHLHDPE